MQKIDKIIIHCSDSEWGDADEIDKWHRAKKYDKIGYHYVILNGHEEYKSKYNKNVDGELQYGRSLSEKGAHCIGHNSTSIGICLIGKNHFSQDQLETLAKVVGELRIKYNLTSNDVYGHYESNSEKTCPNITSEFIRKIV